MKIINKTLLTITAALSLLVFSPGLSLAVDTKGALQCGVNGAAGTDNCDTQPSNTLDGTIKTVVNVLSVAVGVVAVIMIVIGGFRYITSGGKQDAVASAKNTILYAVIGLVIVALAQVIVRFVLHNVTKK